VKIDVPNLRDTGGSGRAPMAEQFKIFSFNANGLANSVKRGGLYVWLDKFNDKKNSIIMLQETHTTLNAEEYWRKEWKGKVFFAHGTSKSRGVATMIPEAIDFKLSHIYEDDEGRYLILVIEICETWVVLINCYAPTVDKPVEQMEWLDKIQLLIEEHSDLPVIMGGDLNDCLIPKLDKYNAKPDVIDTQYVKAIKVLQAEYDLLDIWRTLNPDVRKYTWRQGKTKKNLRQSRLDYWLISSQFAYTLKQVDIQPGYKSDHSMISLVLFRSDISKRGPGLWKFNNSLLRDKKYVEYIDKVMNDSFAKYREIQDKGLGWEMIKMEIRTSTILFSKNKAREKREQIAEMIKEVGTLEQKMNNDPSQDEIERYYNAQKEIELYNIEKANGIMIRAKADNVEFGEKNSKFFLNLEKRNAAKRSITKLVDEQENEITGKDEILDYEKAFYLKLYREQEGNSEGLRAYREARDFFMNDEISGISESDNEKCDRTSHWER
jgi:exonuclease III